MLKGKFPVAGFILLGLSVMIFIFIRQQQATTPNASNGTAITNQRHSSSSDFSTEVIDPKHLSQGIHLVIKVSDRRVYVYHNKKLKVSYAIAVGKAGWETPIGNYKVMDMQRNPVWEEPWTGKVILEGPKNPLGARWIGFWTDGVNSIGFHGTPAEQLVGQAVSHGCVRMRNRDIEALFEQVKIGTPVTVKL